MATTPATPRRPTRSIPRLPSLATDLAQDAASESLPVLASEVANASPQTSPITASISPSSRTDNTSSSAIQSSVFQEEERLHDSPIQSAVPLDQWPVPPQDPLQLTPLRAHYLKKSLIQLQFRNELDLVITAVPNNVSTLSYLGPPFKPPPKGSPTLDLPLLRYVFRRFVLSFPFMAAAPKDFYSDKLQPFVATALSRNLVPTSILDDSANAEQAARLKLVAKAERTLTLLLSGATKLVEDEQVVRLTQADLDRLERLSKKRLARSLKHRDAFQVNIVSVRNVVDKGRVRSKVHEEFIIRTRRAHFHDVYVSRRYGDFKSLVDVLQKHHPTETIPTLPAKDRTTVTAPQYNAPLSPSPSFSSHESLSTPQQYPSQSRLAREKNRLTLRAYLRSLLSSTTIANSPVLKSFLLSSPTKLSPLEIEDVRRREEADQMRDDGRKRFAKEIAARVDSLREAVRGVKGDIMGPDGLTRIFGTIKVTPNVEDLPDNYKAVLEWARISLASTIFQQLVASDNSSQKLSNLKRIHGLMPYFMMKAALRITNPVAMIRSILDLFLAQPFGGRSLLQRMFTSSLTEEVKVLEEEIETVKDKVDDPIICEKMRRFVYAPKEIQDMFKSDAVAEGLHIITIILRSGDEPVLNRMQLHRVAKAGRAHAAYTKHRETLEDSDDDDGPQDEDGWLFEDLRILTILYARLRDREQLISLIFEGFTADLLKDIITIFYSPLAQVYRAASIADSLGDLQNFINDLIKTVESTEELSQQDPHRTVQVFIGLVQAHEPAFYRFVHNVHSKGEGLFDSILRWIELFLTNFREGLGSLVSLEYLLPHTGQARQDILAEVDQVATYHYKLKMIHEDKLRRRFGTAQKGGSADAADEATRAMMDSVAGEIDFGDLVQGDAEAFQAEESESSASEGGSSSDADTLSSEETDESASSSEDESTSEEDTDSQQTPRTPLKPYQNVDSSRASLPLASSSMQPSVALSALRPLSATVRQQSRSLKHSRSFSALKESKLLGSLSRRSNDQAQPPLPPLPSSARSATLSAAMNKPLPASPVVRTSTTPLSGRVPPPSAKPQKPNTTSKPNKAKESLTPPVLNHIHQLRPLFVELMRPILRPQRTT